MQVQQAKSLQTDGLNDQLAILDVLVGEDVGGAADPVGLWQRTKRLLTSADEHDPERRGGFQAVLDHLPVARLKDMQLDGRAWEEHGMKRKERDVQLWPP